MSVTYTEVVTLEKIECGRCAGVFAISDKFLAHQRANKGGYKCPYCGTGWSWSESESDRLRKQLDAANAETQCARQQAQIATSMREAAEQRAAKEARKVKRAENGVCAHCQRSFSSLRRHMASCHGIKNGEPAKPSVISIIKKKSAIPST